MSALTQDELVEALERATRRIDALEAGMRDLLDEARDMRSYVPDYFATKWKHDEALEAAERVLDALTTKAPAGQGEGSREQQRF